MGEDLGAPPVNARASPNVENAAARLPALPDVCFGSSRAAARRRPAR
jgi:hypothetical protein